MSQLGGIFWVRTLHAPSRERPLAPFVPNSQFHRMRSSGAQVAARKSWCVKDMLGAEKRTPRADGIPVEDADARAQAHRPGGPQPCSAVQWCRSPPPRTSLTPHASLRFSYVLPSRAVGRRLAVGDEGRIPLIAKALRALAAPARSDPPFPVCGLDPGLFRLSAGLAAARGRRRRSCCAHTRPARWRCACACQIALAAAIAATRRAGAIRAMRRVGGRAEP